MVCTLRFARLKQVTSAPLAVLGELDDLADSNGAALISQSEPSQCRKVRECLDTDGLVDADAADDHATRLDVLCLLLLLGLDIDLRNQLGHLAITGKRKQ